MALEEESVTKTSDGSLAMNHNLVMFLPTLTHEISTVILLEEHDAIINPLSQRLGRNRHTGTAGAIANAISTTRLEA